MERSRDSGRHPWVQQESWENTESTLSWEVWGRTILSSYQGWKDFSPGTAFWENRALIEFPLWMADLCPTASGNLAGKTQWLEMALWLGPSEDFFIHTRGALTRISWGLGWQMEVWPLCEAWLPHSMVTSSWLDLLCSNSGLQVCIFQGNKTEIAFPLMTQCWWPHSILPLYSSAPSSHKPDKTPGGRKQSIESEICRVGWPAGDPRRSCRGSSGPKVV